MANGVVEEFHPSEWRKYLLDPIIPENEEKGPSRPLALRFPVALIKRLDRAAAATGNSRTQVIIHLLRWGLDRYEQARAADQAAEARISKKSRS